jgi:cysteine desulfurase/selenocysteine lyase
MLFADIRNEFPFFTHNPSTAYLDSAATSLVPSRVYQKVAQFEERVRANAHRGLYREAEEATRLFEKARTRVAHFLGAEPDEVVFVSSATHAANMLAYACEQMGLLREGDDITLSVFDHHALLLPFSEYARRKNCAVRLLPRKGDSLDLEKIEAYIPPHTRLVGMVLASNVTGTRFDVEEKSENGITTPSPWERVRRRAEEVGALTVLDATAAVGHFPLSAKELGADFLFFSGHKVLASQGIGVLYGKKEKLHALPPSFFGGGIVADVVVGEKNITPLWQEGVARFEAGSPCVSGAVGLAEAMTFLEETGLSLCAEHAQELVAYAEQAFAPLSAVLLVSAPSYKNTGIVSFVCQGVHPHDLAQVCAEDGVAVRAGHHCALPLHKSLGLSATLRASVHCYTTKEDIDRLVASVQKALRLFHHA